MKKKSLLKIILGKTSTEERFWIVVGVSLFGVGLMLFMLFLEGKLHLGGILNFGLLTTLHIFVMSAPTAAVLWLFRNQDKKIDHENAKGMEERYYNSIKSSDLYNIILINVGDISDLLERKLKAKQKIPAGRIDSLTIREIIEKSNLYDIQYDIEEEITFEAIIKRLNRYYLSLVNYLEEYAAINQNNVLSEHYANQNYFFIYLDNCGQRVREFLKLHCSEEIKKEYDSHPFIDKHPK